MQLKLLGELKLPGKEINYVEINYVAYGFVDYFILVICIDHLRGSWLDAH